MSHTQAESLAIELMTQRGLIAKGWRFKFDHAARRFGQCSERKRTISLSRKLVELNPEERVRETVLHEVAHALVGNCHGHGRMWRAMAYSLGAKPDRCGTVADTVVPQLRYIATCPACGRTLSRARAPKAHIRSACGPCCNAHNFGRYSDAYRLQFVDTRTEEL